MSPSVVPPRVTDNYDPKAESAATIRDYHTAHANVTNLLFSAQFIFPPITITWLIMLVVYYLYFKGLASKYLEKGKKDDDELRHDTRVKLSIVFTLSFIFSIYSFILSIIALSKGLNELDDRINQWYNTSTKENSLSHRHSNPCQRFILLFVIALMTTILACTKKDVNYWWPFWLCSITANLVVHANYNCYETHAMDVGIFYGNALDVCDVGDNCSRSTASSYPNPSWKFY